MGGLREVGGLIGELADRILDWLETVLRMRPRTLSRSR